MSLSPQALVNIAVQAAKDKKAEDITVLDIRKISIIADYFLICSGRSSTHVQAIVENIQEKLEEKNINALRREGFREGEWVLLDYGDVVIHVFQEAERQFYNLERLWGDAPVVGVPVNI
ncbi:MAG TPA: ribosome silencing factor [Bacillota bacterium]|nr:ribosome silencing factor [Peptococcaceae bacterium MAG4]NLW37027.1 ribosome silencing factor [Peptococcaceae bacterium]HPZ43429.1 ribosome silencing factor [Bacillota bacterium]HQD75905.1 ribosome silencing factor [Bacillota bacterium]HUM58713.1 ribosome silencing factor [Bacillota bacterium]